MHSPEEQQPITAEEIEQAASILRRLEPGKLPLDIFLETARLTVTPIVEVVPLRRTENGTTQVLLTEREVDDPVWGGLLHTPGTVVRASDTPGSFQDAFDRIFGGELRGSAIQRQPVFVDTTLHQVKRGMELAHVFCVEMNESNGVGKFYDAEVLPDNVIDTQREFIRAAVEVFEQVNESTR